MPMRTQLQSIYEYVCTYAYFGPYIASPAWGVTMPALYSQWLAEFFHIFNVEGHTEIVNRWSNF